MLYLLGCVLLSLLALVQIILTTTANPARWSYGPGLAIILVLALGLSRFSAPVRPALYSTHPAILGVPAGLKTGLWTQSLLPPPMPKHPTITWLKTTLDGRKIIKKPISLFRTPAAARFRARGVNFSFHHRFGWCCAMQTDTEPRVIIVHSTEGETEEHAFNIFDRNTGDQYLGGIWSHFAVGPEGNIYQYGPLNRVSKAQAGLDLLSVGIEIVGDASLWDGDKQTKTGSIMTRFNRGDGAQLQAVADLMRTLQAHYKIPNKHIFSHEELGNIRDLRGTYPDYQWLREHIRDGVYLSKVPTVAADGTPRQRYDFLEPYDRQDPGRDVMAILR